MVSQVDKKNNVDVKFSFPKRLSEAIRVCRKLTESMKKHRSKMLTQYASGYFSDKGSIAHPVNLIDRGIQIIGPLLVGGNPTIRIMPKRNYDQFMSCANTFSESMNSLIKEIEFARTLRCIVIDSLFGLGISKIGINKTHEVEIEGYLHDVGQAYFDRVDFEDYVFDVAAKTREQMRLEGNVFRLPTDYIKESGLYKYADDISADYKLYGQTDPEKIAKEGLQDYQLHELREYSNLCELWIPEEKIIVTIQPDAANPKIMRTVEWDGIETGPYDVLGYKYFPNSTLPIPPVFGWMDLDTMVNTLVRKMKEQAEREKSILAYEAEAEQDAKNIVGASDGGSARVQNIDRIKEVTYGGVNPASYQWVQYAESQFSMQGGNLYLMGGRSTSANTLGQEQMLQSNASKAIEDMITQVYEFTQRGIEKLAQFTWDDPLVQIPVIKKIPGVNVEFETVFSDYTKMGNFGDYDIEVEAYSLQRMNPEMRFNKFMQLVSGVVLPTAQMSASQGYQIDANELIREAASYLGVKNLDRWWKSEVPQNVGMNSYQPVQNQSSSGVTDNRNVQGGGSNFNNLIQKENAVAGETTAETGV